MNRARRIEAAHMNLAAALEALAEADPHAISIYAEDRSLTRGEMRAAIVLAARVLHDQWGVGRGDRVGYLGLNRSEQLVLLFALARLGAIYVPLNTRLAVTELVTIAGHAQLHALATDGGHWDVAEVIVQGVARHDGLDIALHPIEALAVEPSEDADDGAATTSNVIALTDDSTPLLLVYTSGTTGAPKGALHTHGGMMANARASIDAHDLVEDDRVLAVLPLFHVGGLCIQTLPALLVGASVALHSRFDAKAWLESMASMRPTLALLVPATLRAVIGEPEWPVANLSCLRVLMTGSSVIPRKLIDAVHARDIPLGQIYGSTETGPVTVALKARDAQRKAGSAGWPCFPDSVRIVAADGREVGAGSVGEVAVRAPNMMHGYWREPASTAFHEGWFFTGDLGRFDDEGALEIVGRNRELIITGGENVYPAEVEDVLLSIDGILEAAVVGMADDTWGEVPVAFVVKSIEAADLDEATVMAAFRDRLGRYKHPKRILFVDQLPRSTMGKVQVHHLRERLKAKPRQ
jgi:fatty-acyl-CoA synthase